MHMQRLNPMSIPEKHLCKNCTVTFFVRKSLKSRKSEVEKAEFSVTKRIHLVSIIIFFGYLPESYQQFPLFFQQP